MGISNEEYLEMRHEEWKRLERRYDFNSVNGIRSIPVPCEEVNGDSPTGRVEYYLRGICFRNHWDSGRIDIAIECLKKAQELMFVSDMIWKYDDFIRLVSYLHEAGRHDEARAEEQRVDNHFKKIGHYPRLKIWNFESLKAYFLWKKQISDLEQKRLRLRQTRHEFYWLQEHARSVCPKSLSGYSKMKGSKSQKYLELKKCASQSGFYFKD